MPELFNKSEINGLALKNRFIRSATWEGMTDDQGRPTQELIKLFEQLAVGQVGLIITGHAFVCPAGRAREKQLAIYNDNYISGLRKLVDRVHKKHGKIVLQISHAGGLADEKMTGSDPHGPSSFENDNGKLCKEMSEQDIKNVVTDFVLASERAKKAGFDGIQLHAAHHYLLSQFLSPYFNKRRDEYGGSIKNRTRIIVEISEQIRETLGKSYPLLIKMNSEDFLEGGLIQEEMLDASELLENAGIDAIELSGGTKYSGDKIPSRIREKGSKEEVYYQNAAKLLKRRCHVPVILVGGIRSKNMAKDLITNKTTDFISLSRPLIKEPDLIKKWKEGKTEESTCISCNGCFSPILSGQGLFCPINQ